eukprot:Skav236322  [mRNA]  locus=scaffold97:166286:170270:+ [translate_table: standard]
MGSPSAQSVAMTGTTGFDAGNTAGSEKGSRDVEDDQLAITLDDLAYRSLTIGIVSGAVWANEAWGNYWSWDPKETWALITWLVYAGYLHTRLQLGWDTRESAKIGAFGFLVNLMGIGEQRTGSPTVEEPEDKRSKASRTRSPERRPRKGREDESSEEERSKGREKSPRKSPRNVPADRDVEKEPHKYGLGKIQARGSVREHFERGQESSGSGRVPEPRIPPARRENPEERRREEPRKRPRRPQGPQPHRERGGRHYQRGVDYWKWVKSQKKK